MAYRSAMDPSPTPPTCARCGKPPELCVCAGIEPVPSRTRLLILQHPQEQDVDLGTARLTALQVDGAVLKVGLSWPNLAKALGAPADPKRWAVLYLGASGGKAPAVAGEVAVVDKKGQPLANQDEALRAVDGLIALDGSWSQAKALWWRNAWLLKCRRLVLNPKRPSRYGKLRKEPRREGLSTLEAVGMALSRLNGNPQIETALTDTFERLLSAYRGRQSRVAAPSP